MPEPTAEDERLREDANREKNWKRWGPYLSERQWGTVREDYSEDGNAWAYFPYEHGRMRTYRWGEDGLLGFCDRQARLCFSLSLWNEKDPFLKERLFGLNGPEGNHGEDVKELYFYLDATPTASWARALYKYPQARFPYEKLREENAKRGKGEREYELLDTGIFDDNRYFDVFVHYAKASDEDLLIEIHAFNRGPEAAALHLLPTFWYRNTWAWGRTRLGYWPRPEISLDQGRLRLKHSSLGEYLASFEQTPRRVLFTENETNAKKLFGSEGRSPWSKDAFDELVVHGNEAAVNAACVGTKAAAWYRELVQPGKAAVLRARLTHVREATPRPFDDFEQVIDLRRKEANQFYEAHVDGGAAEAEKAAARQAYGGLIWSKQAYVFCVKEWLMGDPPLYSPASRQKIRNSTWTNIDAREVISMPDKWEYPWFAAWDLAFHSVAFGEIDPDFAMEQLTLFLREWYLSPTGQIPAYEWEFSDVNPPVHAWAARRLYHLLKARGRDERVFLERIFHKLMLNYAWWVNRKDVDGNNLYAGGFLGLDNIGLFDRSKPLPGGGHLEQSDGTAWMAFFCGEMLGIALELAAEDNAYEDIAVHFFERFVAIANAFNTLGGNGLWDDQDGFFYDNLQIGGSRTPLRVRSMVGLIPLLAVEVADAGVLEKLPLFKHRLEWLLQNRGDVNRFLDRYDALDRPHNGRRLLALMSRPRLERVLQRLFDETEFLSEHGIRALSKAHEKPVVLDVGGEQRQVAYVPGDSDSGLFGGNSNWRGPVWLPLNYLLVRALKRFHRYYGDSFQLEVPTGSGRMMNLFQAGEEIQRRLSTLFLPDATGARKCHGDDPRWAKDPHFKDLLLFHEYFHGDTGRGLGASHQTGWTALAVRWLARPDTAPHTGSTLPGGR
ncbi:MAG: glucosidase [Myxococcaceae bacterium]